MKYLTDYTPQQIFNIHTNIMRSIWNTRIEFIGNETITNGIYASYNNLLNAIRADYAYSTAPGGLVSSMYYIAYLADLHCMKSIVLIIVHRWL